MSRKAISTRTRFLILKRDGFTCQYCGASAPRVELHVDHVIPVAAGGTNDPDNLVSACRDCNLGKSTLPVFDQNCPARRAVLYSYLSAAADQEGDDVQHLVGLVLQITRWANIGKGHEDLIRAAVKLQCREYVERAILDDLIECRTMPEQVAMLDRLLRATDEALARIVEEDMASEGALDGTRG